MAKLNDTLCLFNFGLMNKISLMNAGEIWDFLLANRKRLDELKPPNTSAASLYLYGYAHSFENFKRCFDDEVKEYFEGVVFSTCMDFCFEGKQVVLDKKGASAFLDRADSCDVPISEDFMPPVDDDSEVAYHKEYFHLLEPHHVQPIINALEDGIENLETNSPEDIELMKKMKEHCENDQNYKIAFIFDSYLNL